MASPHLNANEWKLLKVDLRRDGSGDLLPGERHVRSLRAEVGSPITTGAIEYGLRIKFPPPGGSGLRILPPPGVSIRL